MANVDQVVNEVKAGLKTTEFYLSTFVTVAGSLVQFLPANVADATVKGVALVSAVLAALGYTASRTIVKTNSK